MKRAPKCLHDIALAAARVHTCAVAIARIDRSVVGIRRLLPLRRSRCRGVVVALTFSPSTCAREGKCELYQIS